MGHELLLIAGPVGSDAQRSRRQRLQTAAALIPSVASCEITEGPECSVALVTSSPAGGCVAGVETHGDRTVVAVAAHETMLHRTLSSPTLGSSVGAELAHVSVSIDGEIIEISTDGTGFIPSFWAARGNELLFSTSLASLVSLGLDPDPDPIGVVEYLALMHPLGERTVLKDAHLLPAGGRLTRRPGGGVNLEVARLYEPSRDAMDDDAAVAEFRSVWSEVIGDLLERGERGRLALSLSGGLDSRAIATECVRQGAQPLGLTYGGLGTFEGRVAAEVATKLSLDHLLLRVTPERMLVDATGIALSMDGAHSAAELYDAWFCGPLSNVAGGVINGHAGGPLWGDEKALGTRGERALVSALAARYGHELGTMLPFLTSDVRNEAANMLHDSLAASVQEWRPEERTDAVSFWNVHNRQFRWGNMMPNVLRRHGIRVEAPFLDSRFLRFSARLTPEQRRHGNLYLRVQREVFAETARIPRSDDANPPARLDHVYWSADTSFASQFLGLARRHPASAGRRIARRTRIAGGEAVRRLTRLQDFDAGFAQRRTPFPAADWLRNVPTYRHRLTEFLDAAPTTWPLEPRVVEEEVSRLRRGDATSSPLRLAKVATLQTWLTDFTRRAGTRADRG